MTSATARSSLILRGAAILLVALALALRVLVPAGWMPATGQGFALTLCTGTGPATAWVDGRGEVHRGSPSAPREADHPCAFAGIATPALLPALLPLALALPVPAAPAWVPVARVATIGHGLAAPPPPPTGPPLHA